MKKFLLSGVIAFFSTTAIYSQIITISAARTTAIGQTVTVTGTVTCGSEFGSSLRYMQDGTAGIGIFSPSVSAAAPGDLIIVTGTLTEFNSLLQLSPVSGYTLVSSSNPLPTPQVITGTQFFGTSGEQYESELVKFVAGTFQQTGNFTSAPPTSAGTTTVNFSSGNFIKIYIGQSSNPLVGTPIPSGQVDIIGIGSQFCTSPCTITSGGYQLVVRKPADITASSVGLNEISKNSVALSLYPNPANNTINFKVAANEVVNTIVITDVTGRIVFKTSENTTTVNVSNLANGVYNSTISTSKTTYNSRFTVSK